MHLEPNARYTSEEYLALERSSREKHEYFAGEIFATGGANERHNLIITNVVGELSLQLKGRPCKTYANDMRVKVASTGLHTYPDVVVVCGEARFDDQQRDTLLNPTVLIEVLSKSTEAYDRGEKSEHYRQLESLGEYLLISQDKSHLEHYLRQPDHHWLLSEHNGLQSTVRLPAIGCELALAEIYDRVDLSNVTQAS